MERHNREVLTEFIELYCKLPCLWDIESDIYKERNQKDQAWQLLAETLKKIDPTANVALAKKKIQHMRTAYQREDKKIKDSERSGAAEGDVHVPNLWYFNLLSPVFNKKDELPRIGVDTLASDEDCLPPKKKITKDSSLERKKHQLIDTAQALLQRDDKKSCAFVTYVGEQLEQVDTFQRHVAEKLISEVLFLAKTGNLHFESKIVSPSGSHNFFKFSNNISHLPSPSPQHIQQSPSPPYIKQSPSPQNIEPPPSPPYIKQSPSPQNIEQSPSPRYILSSSSSIYSINTLP